MRKAILLLLAVISLGLGVYTVMLCYLISNSPLTYSEVDANNNGIVSYSEAEYSSNYGSRTIQKNGKDCIEYYAKKDGLMLKVNCKSAQK